MQDLMLNDLGIGEVQFMNFYAWYSWPNVVLSCAGGYLIDRVFGIRFGAILFGGFVLLGQILFATGALMNMVYFMYFARFLFGVGGESLAVCQNTYASSWFNDNELNFVFGIQLSMARVGSTVNMNTMQALYKSLTSYTGHTRLGVALMIASITCLFSLICAVVLAYFDWRAKRILRQGSAEIGQVIQLKDLTKFSSALWCLCIICVAYYAAVFPFISLGLVFFERKYGKSPSEAGVINSIVYITSAVASPLVGMMIDFFGRNLYWVMLGVSVTLGCHALMAFTFTVPPLAVMILMGIAYSILASSLWPMVVFVVPPHQRATAYGIMQSIQNLGLGLVSILAGYIVDVKGYLVLEVFFMMCLCLAFLATGLLYLWNLSTASRLNESGAIRRKRIKEEEFLKANQAINNVDESLRSDA
jgi:MFS family permease